MLAHATQLLHQLAGEHPDIAATIEIFLMTALMVSATGVLSTIEKASGIMTGAKVGSAGKLDAAQGRTADADADADDDGAFGPVATAGVRGEPSNTFEAGLDRDSDLPR